MERISVPVPARRHAERPDRRRGEAAERHGGRPGVPSATENPVPQGEGQHCDAGRHRDTALSVRPREEEARRTADVVERGVVLTSVGFS